MMADYDYDLFVIGAGSGGTRASRISSAYGARVAVAEEYRVGGTCVIRGCVPKKLLVYGAHFAEDLKDARRFGWNVPDCAFDWATLRDNVMGEVDRLNGLYTQGLENNGVEIILERATVTGAHEVTLASGKKVTAKYILVAVGAHPHSPEFPGSELGITSNEVFHLDKLPRRVMIAGAGYIANEFAGIFNELGSQVTLINRSSVILRGYDESIRDRLLQISLTKGIEFRFNSEFESIEKQEDGCLKVKTTGHDSVEVDCVLFATGRVPNTQGLGLAEAGVELDANGAIKVDENNRSSVDSIYAVGDVTNRVNLTPVAIREGHAFADTVFGGKTVRVDHGNIPTAVFTQPEVGTVGMTEDEARAAFTHVDIYKTDFRSIKSTISGSDSRVLMKLIVDGASDVVVGCHIVGPEAAELIQILGICIKLKATKADFDATVAVHPSAAEELVTMRTPTARYVREAAE